jgi:hypothetical protein
LDEPHIAGVRRFPRSVDESPYFVISKIVKLPLSKFYRMRSRAAPYKPKSYDDLPPQELNSSTYRANLAEGVARFRFDLQEVPISMFLPKRVNILFCIHTELRSLDYPIQETDRIIK